MIAVTSEHLAALDEDGAVVPLDDQHALRVRVVPDEHSSVFDEDPEVFGKLAWEARGSWDGAGRRPEGFTGGARVLKHDLGDRLWWQPPADLVGDEARLADWARTIHNLVDYGYTGVILEQLETITDSQGGEHVVVVAEASLWGIDSLENGYLAEVVGDLVHELPVEVAP